MIGAYVAKKQGIKAFREVSESVKNYQAPAEQAINGLCIFAGSIFVILPGFISDILGFLLLIGPTRKYYLSHLYINGLKENEKWSSDCDEALVKSVHLFANK